MSVHNVCLVQELRLDDARFHTTPCAPKLVRSVYQLDVGRFFQKSSTFFNLKRRSELQKKTPAVAF